METFTGVEESVNFTYDKLRNYFLKYLNDKIT